MIRNLLHSFLVVLVGASVSLIASRLSAEEPLVFISAFAAGDEGAIHAYQLDVASGKLRSLAKTTDVEHPFFLAVSPDNRFLYSIHAPGQFGGENDEQVTAFALEGRSGKLKLLNRQSARGTAACYLDVDATGKTVLVANYTTGSVAALPVQEDGSLGPAAAFVQHEGSSVNPDRQDGPHAHCIVLSPDNRFALSADLGLDQVLVYQVDPSSAQLKPHQPPFATTRKGAGPRHLTFHPNGRHVYVINELENSVTHFNYDVASGSLTEQKTISTLPEDFDGTSYCADVKITPDGRYLYGTNRGHDSIASYRIRDDGSLEKIAIEPSLGKGPQNLAITSGGELLLCANMPGSNVAVFRIDAASGRLHSVRDPLKMPSPSCIMIR